MGTENAMQDMGMEKFMLHNNELDNKVINVGDKIKDLVNTINDLVDDYEALIEEGVNLGLEEDEVYEGWAGWIGEYEELKNNIEIRKLNL